jgi:acylphosphatase
VRGDTGGATRRNAHRWVAANINDSRLNVICRKCLVSGRVQGVFYRATTAQRARELGVTGYAKNLADGRVEVLAWGDAAAVQALIEWLWTGSSGSKVSSVDVVEVAPSADQCPTTFVSR